MRTVSEIVTMISSLPEAAMKAQLLHLATQYHRCARSLEQVHQTSMDAASCAREVQRLQSMCRHVQVVFTLFTERTGIDANGLVKELWMEQRAASSQPAQATSHHTNRSSHGSMRAHDHEAPIR
jgi:hypothetical protein